MRKLLHTSTVSSIAEPHRHEQANTRTQRSHTVHSSHTCTHIHVHTCTPTHVHNQPHVHVSSYTHCSPGPTVVCLLSPPFLALQLILTQGSQGRSAGVPHIYIYICMYEYANKYKCVYVCARAALTSHLLSVMGLMLNSLTRPRSWYMCSRQLSIWRRPQGRCQRSCRLAQPPAATPPRVVRRWGRYPQTGHGVEGTIGGRVRGSAGRVQGRVQRAPRIRVRSNHGLCFTSPAPHILLGVGRCVDYGDPPPAHYWGDSVRAASSRTDCLNQFWVCMPRWEGHKAESIPSWSPWWGDPRLQGPGQGEVYPRSLGTSWPPWAGHGCPYLSLFPPLDPSTWSVYDDFGGSCTLSPQVAFSHFKNHCA